jgi:UDP-N-acetylglucosamine acyltransferase
MIHPSAIVDKGATIGANVEIGQHAVVEKGAIVGNGCKIGANAIVHCGVILGDNVTLDVGAVVGGLPQDIHFDPATKSGVSIGEGSVLREYVTVHRATTPGSNTSIGKNCYLMANAHIAHDCIVGDGAIIANAVLLAGFVTIGGGAFVGGAACFHQHVRVGERCMVGGMAGVTRDLPPFCMSAERDRLVGLNIVGLRRAGLTREEIAEIKKLFHLVYDAGGSPRDKALAIAPSEVAHDCGKRFVEFFKSGKRGFLHFGSSDPLQE